ncbi:MAG: Hpt domain-containing protein [Treponemataceae bacterium]|nr:Hpt domain-containing protein [Treponemataceae bacterium]
MITVEKLAAFGADTKTALARCMNKDDFYIKLVGMGLNEPRFEQLGAALDAKDYEAAFTLCHSIKGVIGNLGIDPLYNVICEMTELLRAKTDTDYSKLYKNVMDMRSELLAM